MRFKPQVAPYNKLESHDLIIFPKPIGISEQRDAENNPFNFIVFPNVCFDVPFHYPPNLQDILYSDLLTTKIDNSLIMYGNQILEKSGHRTLNFISDLTYRTHNDFKLESRPVGEPFQGDKTFKLKKGSCRDLSWMQIQLLRHLGIAARFVSGYCFIESECRSHELHGWIEVYLPGAGWIGFDPSHGSITGSSHISVSSSAHYQNTMPVTGSFRGRHTGTMEVSLSIEKI